MTKSLKRRRDNTSDHHFQHKGAVKIQSDWCMVCLISASTRKLLGRNQVVASEIGIFPWIRPDNISPRASGGSEQVTVGPRSVGPKSDSEGFASLAKQISFKRGAAEICLHILHSPPRTSGYHETQLRVAVTSLFHVGLLSVTLDFLRRRCRLAVIVILDVAFSPLPNEIKLSPRVACSVRRFLCTSAANVGVAVVQSLRHHLVRLLASARGWRRGGGGWSRRRKAYSMELPLPPLFRHSDTTLKPISVPPRCAGLRPLPSLWTGPRRSICIVSQCLARRIVRRAGAGHAILDSRTDEQRAGLVVQPGGGRLWRWKDTDAQNVGYWGEERVSRAMSELDGRCRRRCRMVPDGAARRSLARRPYRWRAALQLHASHFTSTSQADMAGEQQAGLVSGLDRIQKATEEELEERDGTSAAYSKERGLHGREGEGEGEGVLGVLMLLVGKSSRTSSTTGVRKDTASRCSASCYRFQRRGIAEWAYHARSAGHGGATRGADATHYDRAGNVQKLQAHTQRIFHAAWLTVRLSHPSLSATRRLGNGIRGTTARPGGALRAIRRYPRAGQRSVLRGNALRSSWTAPRLLYNSLRSSGPTTEVGAVVPALPRSVALEWMRLCRGARKRHPSTSPTPTQHRPNSQRRDYASHNRSFFPFIAMFSTSAKTIRTPSNDLFDVHSSIEYEKIHVCTVYTWSQRRDLVATPGVARVNVPEDADCDCGSGAYSLCSGATSRVRRLRARRMLDSAPPSIVLQTIERGGGAVQRSRGCSGLSGGNMDLISFHTCEIQTIGELNRREGNARCRTQEQRWCGYDVGTPLKREGVHGDTRCAKAFVARNRRPC
ncbi:hypothetical protein C8J57DRAFT_1226975 [Mycena rebaudengoi]|nr:hypothetical protein C8J57DRAFT_1226975 [Mycena rebaudengoi]